MKKRMVFGLLILLVTVLSLTSAHSAQWWDKFGKPKYGGVINFASARFSDNFDAYSSGYSAHMYFLEPLWIPDWSLDREVWAFPSPFIPMDYYGFDERHPENRLPYADTFKVMNIKDIATRVAALRSGRVDFADEMPLQQAQALTKSKSDLLQKKLPFISSHGIDMRVDPERAKQLLADAGYPHGFETEIYADNSADVGLLEVIKAYFKDIGVEMKINITEIAIFENLIHSRKINQMAWNRNTGSTGENMLRMGSPGGWPWARFWIDGKS